MDLRGKKILVTGAGGFIGSHLTEELIRQGCDVRAFVHYNSFNSWGWLDHSPEEIKKEIDIFPGDIRDPHGVKKAMEDRDIVFHLAALIAIPYSYHSPDTYVDTNIKGTLNVIQAVKENDVEKVIHTSTSEVYGTARFVPITEEHSLQGQSPYSATKIGADQIAMSFYLSFDTPVAVIRPFNTYGPRQSTRAVIPTIITQALTSDRVVLGNLHPKRDFTFISDTVGGFLKAAETPQALGLVLNLGTGRDISIGDLAHLILKIVGRSVEIVTDTERVRPEDSEVDRLCADYSLAAQVLDWSPLVPLEEGLARTVEWMRSHLAEYRLIGQYNI